jgi:hypothetical protein
MASYVPLDDEPAEPTPRWRKLVALVGWGLPIAVLIALNIWGLLQLAQGPPTSAPVTTDNGTTTIESPSPEASPQLPLVITPPSVPALPSEMALPPGL